MFTDLTQIAFVPFCGISFALRRILGPRWHTMKEDEKQPRTWETVDPKPPIIQSGHMENRIRR